MERVKAIPIATYCELHGLTLPQRVQLMRTVCEAAQNARQQGALQLDLTASHVLVVDADGQRRVKITGSGPGKAVAAAAPPDVGTVEYAAPEPTAPANAAVDARDVAALGLALHELLLGRMPVADAPGPSGIQHSPGAAPPSARFAALSATKAAAIAAGMGLTPKALLTALRTDFDHVLQATAMGERRYDNPEALSADLQRFLDHEPLAATPQHTRYRLQKLFLRHQKPCLLAAAVLLTGIVGSIVVTCSAVSATARARQQSESAARAIAARESAVREAQRREAELGAFEQLSVVVSYQHTMASERTLHPPWPDRIEAMENWLHDVALLLQKKQEIERMVQALPDGASPPREADQDAAPRAFESAAAAQRFLHDTLTQLLADIGRLETDTKVGVEQCLAWAKRIAALTQEHPNARHDWGLVRRAIAAADGLVASKAYGGQAIELRDDDVLGLVPIGMNPMTRLWEFYDLRSAFDGSSDPATLPIPTQRPDGAVDMTDASGLVFVLLPGAEFRLNSSAAVPEAAASTPAPVVRVAPFFLSKYEMTQGQWARLWLGDEAMRWPSEYRAGTLLTQLQRHIAATEPVTRVDWQTGAELLRQYGMCLPSEAQWESTCRAGTETPWSCPAEDLWLHANLADEAARRADPESQTHEAWDDGHAVPAPPNALRPNAFGLFHMHGNVAEWCLELASGDDSAGSPGPMGLAGSPLLLPLATPSVRGGSYRDRATMARSAMRRQLPPTVRAPEVGLRPARMLHRR